MNSELNLMRKTFLNNILKSKEDLTNNPDLTKVKRIEYRPFDKRYTFYSKNKGFHARPVYSIMKHFLKSNYGLVVSKKSRQLSLGYMFITNSITDLHILDSAADSTYIFPLYLYFDTNSQQTIKLSTERTPNLNAEIVKQIAECLGLEFVAEKFSSFGGSGKNSPPLEGCPTGGVVVTTIRNIPIIRNFVENLPYNPALSQLAKDKRKAGILSEVLFWQQVHKGKFHKIDFDRQRIIGNYIVDFYIKTLGLVIEIDGSSHDNKIEYDTTRQLFLENLGLKVYRIADIDVKKNLDIVMQSLEKYIIQEYAEKPTPPVGHPSKGGEFAPIDILDYIYAVLHSPSYREKYKEFLKIDFPRVPYPKDKETFWQLVNFGGELRQIHLLESPIVENYITQYPEDGNNMVVKPRMVHVETHGLASVHRVYINDTQYFDHVPEVAWNFYIGGYQPAQKWLKDRKERKLEFDDILHYQKIIVALSETDRLMKEIDNIEIE